MSSKYSKKTGELKPSEVRRIKERDAFRAFCKKHDLVPPETYRRMPFSRGGRLRKQEIEHEESLENL